MDKNMFNDAVLEASRIMSEVRKAAKELFPTPFMKEKMTSRQFKAKYGMGLKQYEAFRAKHSPEVWDGLMEKVKEVM